jgi:hypothetical protein
MHQRKSEYELSNSVPEHNGQALSLLCLERPETIKKPVNQCIVIFIVRLNFSDILYIVQNNVKIKAQIILYYI